MTHEEAQALWLLANDGALDAERHALLDAHMEGCPSCRDAVDRLAATDRALRAWGAVRPPAAPAGEAAAPTAAAAPAPISAVRQRPWWPIALAAGLAGVALGIAGSAVLSPASTAPTVAATPRAPSDAGGTFVLMLEEPASQWPPAAPLQRPGYFEWMDSLQARGEYVGGERLSEDEGRYLGRDGSAMPAGQRPGCSENFSGMFLVRARDYDDAVAIARGSPHLAFGGILVRRVY